MVNYMDEKCGMHRRDEKFMQFFSGGLKLEGKRLVRRCKWEQNIKTGLNGKAWTRFIWLRIGISGGLLSTR
jgi:hypothetical protein